MNTASGGAAAADGLSINATDGSELPPDRRLAWATGAGPIR